MRDAAAQLEEMGYVKRPPVYDGGGGVIAIRPSGLRAAGLPINSRSTTSSPNGLAHGRGVSWIAAFCERRGRAWLGPTELRAAGWVYKLAPSKSLSAKTHFPDLGFVHEDGDRWAVEYERVTKSAEVLRRNLDGYLSAQIAGKLGVVLYVCENDAVAEVVRSAVAELGPRAGRKLELVTRSLDEVIAEARAS